MADRSLYTFTPKSADTLGSNFPELARDGQDRFYLAFDAATDETCAWVIRAPVGITTPIQLVGQYYMATATSGTIDFEAAVEAISDGDTVDMDAASSFDTVNTMSPKTVPGTAGYIDEFTITLTNADSIAAGDYVRFSFMRDADGGSAGGDCRILQVELLDDGG